MSIAESVTQYYASLSRKAMFLCKVHMVGRLHEIRKDCHLKASAFLVLSAVAATILEACCTLYCLENNRTSFKVIFSILIALEIQIRVPVFIICMLKLPG